MGSRADNLIKRVRAYLVGDGAPGPRHLAAFFDAVIHSTVPTDHDFLAVIADDEDLAVVRARCMIDVGPFMGHVEWKKRTLPDAAAWDFEIGCDAAFYVGGDRVVVYARRTASGYEVSDVGLGAVAARLRYRAPKPPLGVLSATCPDDPAKLAAALCSLIAAALVTGAP